MIKSIQNEAERLNYDLELSTSSLHEVKINQVDKETFNKTENKFNSAKKLQKTNIKKYEDDKKRYKIMKKYGEVLHLVEKLLGLIPSDLTNLSHEELEEKLKELLKSRKNTENQMLFVFYQNLISDLLTNLTRIEEDYVNKRISSKQAYDSVQESKAQIKEYYKEAPESLKEPIKNASYLVSLYEESYNRENIENFNPTSTELKSTEFNPKHKEIFSSLNEQTNSLISNVNSLSTNLSNFEPQVDLNPLSKNLEKTEFISSLDNWDPAEMQTAVEDLKSTTVSLTYKQIDLNNQREQLESDITTLTETSKDLSAKSTQNTSNETYMDTTIRVASHTTQTQLMQENLHEDDDDFWLGIILATALTMNSQVIADQEYCDTISQDPNVNSLNMDLSSIALAEQRTFMLHQQAQALQELRIQQQRQIQLNPDDKKE